MKRVIIWISTLIVVLIAWAGVNFVATTEGWLLSPIAPKNNTQAFIDALQERAISSHQGNLAYAILEENQVVAHEYLSRGRPVNENTRFGVASLSKWVTAIGVFTLVEQGKLDLDAPVSGYLTRWQLPQSQFDNNGVTVRRLLSHTAGITDGLGHSGFAPGEPVQPLTSHLTQALDADPGKSGKVEVGIEPGTKWMYSGGSYNLIQLIVEEVTGLSFVDVMQQNVFGPLGMTSTSFEIDRDASDVAEYFGAKGELQTYPNYTSLAATGLYTTVNDLVRLVRSQMLLPNLDGQMRVLSDDSLAEMRKPLANVDGLDIWGAGVMLFAPHPEGDYVIGHGGQSPYLNASVRLDPMTGDAFIALETGNENTLASELATHWTTWLTGKPDIFVLNNTIPAMFNRIAVGALVILLVFIAWPLWCRFAKPKAK